MRQKWVALCMLSLLVPLVPMSALAQAKISHKGETEITYNNHPVAQVVMLPFHLVAGTIGATTGLFTGFNKGFTWPRRSRITETTTTSIED